MKEEKNITYVSKALAKHFLLGIKGSYYFSFLIEEQQKQNKEWFFIRQIGVGEKSIASETGLGKNIQDNYLFKLECLSLIEIKHKGLPKRFHYKINYKLYNEINKKYSELSSEMFLKYLNKNFFKHDYYKENSESGVYGIEIGDSNYIGSSSNLSFRENSHKLLLKKGNHYNQKMQKAYNNCGSFKFHIIGKCHVSELKKIESAYIRLCKPSLNVSETSTQKSNLETIFINKKYL